MALMSELIPVWHEAHVKRDVGVIYVVRAGPVSHRDLGGAMVMAPVRPVVSCCSPKERVLIYRKKQNVKPTWRATTCEMCSSIVRLYLSPTTEAIRMT